MIKHVDRNLKFFSSKAACLHILLLHQVIHTVLIFTGEEEGGEEEFSSLGN